MNPQATREHDGALALGVLALAIVGLTLGYAPWVLVALLLATIVVLVAGLAADRPGLLARRAAGVFILMLIPAGLQVYAFYPAFLRAYNPRHAILPVTHATAWHPAALAHYTALLATLTVTGAALVSSLILTYRHIQQRRSAAPAHTGHRSAITPGNTPSPAGRHGSRRRPPRSELTAGPPSSIYRPGSVSSNSTPCESGMT